MGDRDPEAQLVPIRGEKKTCLCGFYADSGSQHAQNPRFLKEPPGEKQFPHDMISYPLNIPLKVLTYLHKVRNITLKACSSICYQCDAIC